MDRLLKIAFLSIALAGLITACTSSSDSSGSDADVDAAPDSFSLPDLNTPSGAVWCHVAQLTSSTCGELPCPASPDDVHLADLCAWYDIVVRWTVPCDGLIAVGFINVDCGMTYYFNGTSPAHELEAVVSGCGPRISSIVCTTNLVDFRLPTDCPDSATSAINICAPPSTDGGGEAG